MTLTTLNVYREMSPVAYAKNAKTPLLVLHGQSDLRCPQEQGEQMYMATA